MTYLQWFKQRLVLLRRMIIELYNKIIYQQQSQFILHRLNAHRCSYESMLFYSFIGRFFFALKEFGALISNNNIFKMVQATFGFVTTYDY